MAARSWEQLDADLAAGRSQRDIDREILFGLMVAGNVPIEKIKKAMPKVKITYCPPAIAKGATFMGGRPNIRAAQWKAKS